MVYILLGDGFEEIEALAPADLLRRAGLKTALVGVDQQMVTGGHGITVTADLLLKDVCPDELDMLVIPGGMGGVDSIRRSRDALILITRAYETGRYLAAICAGPTILAELGYLDRRSATCYPGLEGQMQSAVIKSGASIVVDGRIITGRGAGSAIEFGLTLIRALAGEQAAEEVRSDIHYQG